MRKIKSIASFVGLGDILSTYIPSPSTSNDTSEERRKDDPKEIETNQALIDDIYKKVKKHGVDSLGMQIQRNEDVNVSQPSFYSPARNSNNDMSRGYFETTNIFDEEDYRHPSVDVALDILEKESKRGENRQHWYMSSEEMKRKGAVSMASAIDGDQQISYMFNALAGPKEKNGNMQMQLICSGINGKRFPDVNVGSRLVLEGDICEQEGGDDDQPLYIFFAKGLVRKSVKDIFDDNILKKEKKKPVRKNKEEKKPSTKSNAKNNKKKKDDSSVDKVSSVKRKKRSSDEPQQRKRKKKEEVHNTIDISKEVSLTVPQEVSSSSFDISDNKILENVSKDIDEKMKEYDPTS